MHIKKKILGLVLAITMVVSCLNSVPERVKADTVNTQEKANNAVKLKENSAVIKVGEKKKIKIQNLSKKAKISYKSTKKAVVSINNKGIIKGKKTGNAQINILVTLDKKTIKFIYKVKVVKNKSYKVSFKTYCAKKIKTQRVNRGKYINLPKEPTKKGYQFVGWFKTKNPKDWSKRFNFSKSRVKSNLVLHAVWVDINKDTDKDGIPDQLEDKLRTNKKKKDTDKDGLTDYQEVVIVGTNPLKKDTDNNGISDYKDDVDGDKLSNGKEVKIGSNPVISDTDLDGLNDYEEVNKYKTSPVKKDTDGDGAEDGWEIANGFDPNKFNSSFEIVKDTGKVSEYQPVVASVKIEVDGKQVESLSVKPVNYSDNHWVTPAIAGYLGNAYEFNVDGKFKKAELTFEYDTKIGMMGKNFAPRIYYLDNDTGLLAELENQIVENGKVTAITTHFSTYILLNKVEYDRVWKSDIKPPSKKTDAGDDSLDVVFVIDYSHSMLKNDPYKMFRSVSINFIDNLRENKDKASVIKFVRYPSLLQELTYNKDFLRAAVAGIEYDDAKNKMSGTNGSGAYKLALEQLKNSSAANKYIIFLTDGEDTHRDYSYEELIEESKAAGVNVYTIGMGGASDKILRNIAQSTGGKFFYASRVDNSENMIKLNENLKETVKEVIPGDSNGDGISDYYNDLIKSGKLVLSNCSKEFEGIDFNYDKDGKPSDDYDGDGLKNGEEIEIKDSKEFLEYIEKGLENIGIKNNNLSEDQRLNKVFIVKKSDPTLVNSDGDEFNDYQEVKKRFTNPLISEFTVSDVDFLCNDDLFTYSFVAKLNDKDPIPIKGIKALMEQATMGVSGLEKKVEWYYKTYVDYFAYNLKEDLEKEKISYEKGCILGVINDLIAKVNYDVIKDGFDSAKPVVEPVELNNDFKKMVLETMNAVNEEDIQRIKDKFMGFIRKYNNDRPIQVSVKNKLKYLNKGLDKAFSIYNKVENVNEVINDIAKMSEAAANIKVFEENRDILEKLSKSEDANACYAALRIIIGMEDIDKSLGDMFISKSFLWLSDKTFKQVAEKLGGPYLTVVLEAKDFFSNFFKIEEDFEQVYKDKALFNLSSAIIELLKPDLLKYGNSTYQIGSKKEDEAKRKMILLAEARILGLISYRKAFKGENGEDDWWWKNITSKLDNQEDFIEELEAYTRATIEKVEKALENNGLALPLNFKQEIEKEM